MRGEVRTQDLIAHARASGFEVSVHQLKRLRREGLLPQPVQKHVVGREGSVVRYPDAALTQLDGVLHIKNHGYRTFRELRVACWLDGLVVDFKLLRPDVVAILRSELAGLPRRTTEIDDEVDRTVSQLTRGRTRSKTAPAFRKAVQPETPQGTLLAVLQIALNTRFASLAAETVDSVFDLGADQPVSQPYLNFDPPGLTHWPRVLSRTGEKWFPLGPNWLLLIKQFLSDAEQQELLSPTAASRLMLQHIKDPVLDESPSTLSARTLLACQGIVLARSNPDLMMGLFKPAD